MPFITWSDNFLIGLPAVDHEHRELIARINEILTQAGQHRGGTLLADCLGELHGAIAGHFALEEQIMQEHGYTEFHMHKADHEQLLDDIHDLMAEVDDPERLDMDGFSVRLTNWFLEHFSSFDARLHKHLGC